MNEEKIMGAINDLGKNMSNLTKKVDNLTKDVGELKNKVSNIEKKLDNLEKTEKSHFEYACNEFERIENKIDSNFKHLNDKIDNTKDKIVSEVIDVLEDFSIVTSKSIENVENKLRTESKEREYQIERLNNLTEYDKIVLKNLESRISILEEESQKYNKE